MANHWGGGFYHFLVEALPRMTTMLDVLLEQPDIKVPSPLSIGRDQIRRHEVYSLYGRGMRCSYYDEHKTVIPPTTVLKCVVRRAPICPCLSLCVRER